MASDGEIGRMTDADGEPLIFEVYSDGSAGASDGQAQRFRLATQQQKDAFAQLLNATFLAAERQAEAHAAASLPDDPPNAPDESDYEGRFHRGN